MAPFLIGAESDPESRWFAYLFALTDCTAFKVGFACNPLQRICTFSRRYYEGFDLPQSWLFEVNTCDQARALEATIKTQLAMYRMDSPSWIPREAGGHTEWFSAVYFGEAEAHLRAFADEPTNVRVVNAFDSFKSELAQARSSFERWALNQALQVNEQREFAERGYAARDHRAALRDWLDAYRYFDVPLFAEQDDLLAMIMESVRSRP